MCGIFSYICFRIKQENGKAFAIMLNGLKRLEYRGYDSCGLCMNVVKRKSNLICKSKGKVEKLHDDIIKGLKIDLNTMTSNHIGIAHTRWATHGAPSEENSHPFRSDSNNLFTVVHNGVFPNYKSVRDFLVRKGHVFESETDTECAAKLALHFYNDEIEKNNKPTFLEIVKKVLNSFEGVYSFIFISSLYSNEVIAVRNGSPLIVGVRGSYNVSLDSVDVNFEKVGEKQQKFSFEDTKIEEVCETKFELRDESDSEESDLANNVEIFIASDPCAIVEQTRNVIYLEDNDIVHVKDGILMIHRPNTKEDDKSTCITRKVERLETEISQLMKGKYDFFMEKEIFEQSETILRTMRDRIDFEKNQVILGGLDGYLPTIKKSTRFLFIACGTSYHSSLALKILFEEIVNVPIMVEIASDFVDRQAPVFETDSVFFVSQSGETADTISAMKYCIEKKAFCIGVTNTVGSTISRETKCGVHINAGPEIGVASTKAYTSQYIALVLIALQIGQDNVIHQERIKNIIEELKKIPDLVKETLELNDQIKAYAYENLKEDASLLLLGRGYQHATCLEGALKIKEVAYIHSEGILAGELKHGPLALVDDRVNLLLIVINDETITKTRNALQQILARKGKPFIICTKDIASEFKNLKLLSIPKTIDCLQGILTVIPLQLISFHLAVARDYDVDCPRNLAKSVTVE